MKTFILENKLDDKTEKDIDIYARQLSKRNFAARRKKDPNTTIGSLCNSYKKQKRLEFLVYKESVKDSNFPFLPFDEPSLKIGKKEILKGVLKNSELIDVRIKILDEYGSFSHDVGVPFGGILLLCDVKTETIEVFWFDRNIVWGENRDGNPKKQAFYLSKQYLTEEEKKIFRNKRMIK